MPFGSGFPVAFGGEGVVPLSEPRSNVGDPPVGFDFTTDPDGPLPGAWEFFVLEDDGAGNKTTQPEADPTYYFRVADGLGWWRYTRQPTIPGLGAPFQERGALASPVGIILGPCCELELALRRPPDLLDGKADEFVYEVILGFQGDQAATSFYGARLRANWSGGVWAPAVAFDLVRAQGQNPGQLVAFTFDPVNVPTDVWLAAPLCGLKLNVRNTLLQGFFNDVAVLETAVPNTGGRVIVLARVYNRFGAAIVPVPVIAGFTLQTLRDLVSLGPTPAIPGQSVLEAAQLPVVRLPMNELVDAGFFKRVGARVWRCVADVEVNVQGFKNAYRVGEVLRLAEPAGEKALTQPLVSVIADLSGIRAARERGGPAGTA
jgi:hypothetical protein